MTLVAQKTSVAVRGQNQHLLLSLAGIGALLLLWWIGGSATRFLPSIGEVLTTFPQFLSQGYVWGEALLTTVRVLAGLTVAFVLGGAAAWLMWRNPFWGRVAGIYVSAAVAVPSTILALLALFVFRKTDVGVIFVLALTTFPFIAVILREGLNSISQQLGEMAKVYRLGGIGGMRHLIFPQLISYFFMALRNEYAHAWKVVVLAELFIINSGMGWQFSQAFDRFQLVLVMHWLLLFVAVLLISEYFVIHPIEKRVLRWKGQHS